MNEQQVFSEKVCKLDKFKLAETNVGFKSLRRHVKSWDWFNFNLEINKALKSSLKGFKNMYFSGLKYFLFKLWHIKGLVNFWWQLERNLWEEPTVQKSVQHQMLYAKHTYWKKSQSSNFAQRKVMMQNKINFAVFQESEGSVLRKLNALCLQL